MEAIDTVKAQLRPQLDALIRYLDDTDQTYAAGFFTQILVKLIALDDEETLLELFLELSTTAFIGVSFDEQASTMIDAVLANAQEVAATFSVSRNHMH